MPKGTKVHRCVEKVKKSGKANPYAVCQASTKQSYATGKELGEEARPGTLALSRGTTGHTKPTRTMGDPPGFPGHKPKTRNPKSGKSPGSVRDWTTYKNLALALLGEDDKLSKLSGPRGLEREKIQRSEGFPRGKSFEGKGTPTKSADNPKLRPPKARLALTMSNEYKRIGITLAEKFSTTQMDAIKRAAKPLSPPIKPAKAPSLRGDARKKSQELAAQANSDADLYEVKKPSEPAKRTPAKKLKDSADDAWEKEEKKEGYRTPTSDDDKGYTHGNSENASDDFNNGRWNTEILPKHPRKRTRKVVDPSKKIDEVAPAVVAGAGTVAKTLGPHLLRKGGLSLARTAGTGTLRRTAGKGASTLAKNPKTGQVMGQAAETGIGKLLAKKRSGQPAGEEEMETQSTQYNNAYVNKLMEMDLKPGQTKEGRASLFRYQAELAKLDPQQRAKRAKAKPKVVEGYRRIGNLIGDMVAEEEKKPETTKEKIDREQAAERKRPRWKTKRTSGMRGLSPGEAAEFGGDTSNDPRTTGLPK